MNKVRKAVLLSLGLILLSPMLLLAKTEAKAGATLENLNMAYSGGMNAQTKYLAYAEKAQTEGYLKAAKLFRAIAKSEGMHAAGYAKTIEGMGGKPEHKAQDIKVGTTEENLDAAIAATAKKVEMIYPEFIQQAEKEKKENAMKAFGGGKVVKANYNKLLIEASVKLSDWKANGDVYICKVCGNVVTKLDFEFCPVCKVPVSEYEKVS